MGCARHTSQSPRPSQLMPLLRAGTVSALSVRRHTAPKRACILARYATARMSIHSPRSACSRFFYLWKTDEVNAQHARTNHSSHAIGPLNLQPVLSTLLHTRRDSGQKPRRRESRTALDSGRLSRHVCLQQGHPTAARGSTAQHSTHAT